MKNYFKNIYPSELNLNLFLIVRLKKLVAAFQFLRFKCKLKSNFKKSITEIICVERLKVTESYILISFCPHYFVYIFIICLHVLLFVYVFFILFMYLQLLSFFCPLFFEGHTLINFVNLVINLLI